MNPGPLRLEPTLLTTISPPQHKVKLSHYLQKVTRSCQPWVSRTYNISSQQNLSLRLQSRDEQSLQVQIKMLAQSKMLDTEFKQKIFLYSSLSITLPPSLKPPLHLISLGHLSNFFPFSSFVSSTVNFLDSTSI